MKLKHLMLQDGCPISSLMSTFLAGRRGKDKRQLPTQPVFFFLSEGKKAFLDASPRELTLATQ